MAKQTIQQAKDKLESLINEKLAELQDLTQKYKELDDQITNVQCCMALIVKELEPVKSLVLQENPSYATLLESLRG